MRFSAANSRTARLDGLLVAAALVLLVAGCATPGESDAKKPASSAPDDPAEIHAAVPGTLSQGKEISCRIEMIDGRMVAPEARLSRGRHRLIVALGENPGEYSGDVDLLVPARNHFHLKAERDGDIFTVLLVEDETATPVAISSASAAPAMRFQVFVLQK